ncbi:MAG TPA: hypothetical protein DF427_01275 [Moraxellaceae bacterium]|nr:hypothetical protein [Moraxellaceae bacterium]
MAARFRTLNLIDEFNREALAIEVDTSMPSARVIRTLEQVKGWRPLPQSIRVDNGTRPNWPKPLGTDVQFQGRLTMEHLNLRRIFH